jgi:hypothetical protein
LGWHDEEPERQEDDADEGQRALRPPYWISGTHASVRQ